MKYFNNKISELIEGQLPNFLQEEGPKFIKFVEKYYEWMETSKIEVSATEELDLNFSDNLYDIRASKSINNGEFVKHIHAKLVNSYRLNSGNYVFFIKEYEKDDPNVPVTRGFSSGDDIIFTQGNSDYSGSIQVISYIQNVNLSSKNIWNLQDIDRTLDEYVDFFMKEYLQGFPLSFPNQQDSSDIDVDQFKKFLVKHSREFYQSKGTEDSFKYFFRTIFNEEINLKYPKEDILKPSDNTFESTSVLTLRPLVDSVPDISSKRITGTISKSFAYVEKISRFKKGGYDVFEIVLNKSSINGEFKLDEIVEDHNGISIGRVYYGASEIQSLSSASFSPEQKFYVNRLGQLVDYTSLSNSDRGSTIEFAVCEVNGGNITGIKQISGIPFTVVRPNQYNLNVVFDNSGCFNELGVKRPIIATADWIEDSQEYIFNIKREGKGYIKHPKIVSIGTNNVSNYGFEFESSNVGTIKTLKIRERGLGYDDSIKSYDEDGWNENSELILRPGEIGVNTTRNLFKIGNGYSAWKYLAYDSRDWNENLIFGSSYLDVDLNESGTTDVRIKIASVFNDGGKFLNTNSFLSDSKVLQDSKYYQTFSYLLETSIQVNKFKDLLKRLIHPAGMEMFGNILLETKETVGISSQDLKMVFEIVIEEFVSHFDNVVIEDFQNHIISNRNVSIFNSGGANLPDEDSVYIIDGGVPSELTLDDINSQAYLSSMPSWDRVYQIYKIKYRNLIAAPENESNCQKLNLISDRRRVIKLDPSDTSSIPPIGAKIGTRHSEPVDGMPVYSLISLGSLDSHETIDGYHYLYLIPNLNFEEEYFSKNYADVSDYHDRYVTKMAYIPYFYYTDSSETNPLYFAESLNYSKPYTELSVSLDAQDLKKISSENIKLNGKLNVGDFFSVDFVKPIHKIKVSNLDINLFRSGDEISLEEYTGDLFFNGAPPGGLNIIGNSNYVDKIFSKHFYLIVKDLQGSISIGDKIYLTGSNSYRQNIYTVQNFENLKVSGNITEITQEGFVLADDPSLSLIDDYYNGSTIYFQNPGEGLQECSFVIEDYIASTRTVIISGEIDGKVTDSGATFQISTEIKLKIVGYDYSEDWLMFQSTGSSVVISNDSSTNSAELVKFIPRKYGIINNVQKCDDSTEFEIEHYIEEFDDGEILIKKFESNQDALIYTVEFTLKDNQLIEGQSFKVKEIDEQSNFILTNINSEVEFSSGELNVLMSV